MSKRTAQAPKPATPNPDVAERLREEKLRREAHESVKDHAPKIELRKLRKHGTGMEGSRWSCELWVNDRKAAVVNEDGDGGGLRIEWLPQAKGTPNPEKALTTYCALIPSYPFYGTPMTTTVDLLIGELVEEEMERENISRQCKKTVPFRTRDMLEGQWMLRSGLFTVEARRQICSRYGDDVVFAHERYLRMTPIESIPADADVWVPNVLKGFVVLRSPYTKGLWTGYKAKLTPETRASFVAKHGQDAVFLNDIIDAALRTVTKAA